MLAVKPSLTPALNNQPCISCQPIWWQNAKLPMDINGLVNKIKTTDWNFSEQKLLLRYLHLLLLFYLIISSWWFIRRGKRGELNTLAFKEANGKIAHNAMFLCFYLLLQSLIALFTASPICNHKIISYCSINTIYKKTSTLWINY